MPPGYELAVVGEELELEEDEQRHRSDEQTGAQDVAQQEAYGACSNLARAGEQLNENIAGELTAKARPGSRIADLQSELAILVGDLASEQDEME